MRRWVSFFLIFIFNFFFSFSILVNTKGRFQQLWEIILDLH